MVSAFMLGAAPEGWEHLLTRIQKQKLDCNLFATAGLLKPRKNDDGWYDAFRNRLIFPICDELNNPIAFGARKIDPEDEPKYLNSAESALFQKSRTLYGLNRAKRAIIESRRAIITEGYTDVIACHQAGICNVVGTLGTALTREHARLLSKLCDTVVLVFDGDAAGQRAADRGVNVFFTEPVDVRICVLPDEFDPDELLKQPDGRERFLSAMDSSVDAVTYRVSRFKAELSTLNSLSARQKKLEEFLVNLADLGFNQMQGVRKRPVLAHLSDLLGVPVAELERMIPRTRPRSVAGPAEGSDTRRSAGEGSMFEPAGQGSALSRARRLAEHELLSILLFDCEAGLRPIGGHPEQVAVVNRYESEHFQDPTASAIARVLWNRLRGGTQYVMQQVLGELKDEESRSVASRLYFEGQSRCGAESENSMFALLSAIDALEACTRREQHEQTVARNRPSVAADAASALQLVLDSRRQAGSLPGAIASGVRT